MTAIRMAGHQRKRRPAQPMELLTAEAVIAVCVKRLKVVRRGKPVRFVILSNDRDAVMWSFGYDYRQIMDDPAADFVAGTIHAYGQRQIDAAYEDAMQRGEVTARG